MRATKAQLIDKSYNNYCLNSFYRTNRVCQFAGVLRGSIALAGQLSARETSHLDGLTFLNSGETTCQGTNSTQGRQLMGKRDDLIQKYAQDLQQKCNVTPDMDLLRKVTIGCGPAIYNDDASTVSGSDPDELNTVKKNFLVKKLGLSEQQDLDGGIASVIETYGRSNRNKYRAVVYYLLTKHFGKESAYG